MVAALGELTAITLPLMRNKMLLNPTGRMILRTRPLISTESLQNANIASLPFNTFGRRYHEFMVRNNLTADSRSPVRIRQ